jgi:uncharacterized membrane protein YeaQ/YmgE (transglycosylase-associated protein family)
MAAMCRARDQVVSIVAVRNEPTFGRGPEPARVRNVVPSTARQKPAPRETSIMGLIIILIVGAVVGWLAGIITRSGGGLLFDILVGIVGALIAGWLFGGGASILNGPVTMMSFLYSLLGAVILLLIVKLIRRAT